MLLIVHLVESSARHSWIENQMAFFKESGIDQALLSIAAQGDIHAELRLKGFPKVQNIGRGIFGFLHTCLTLKKWSRNQQVYIYAHGHLASLYASLIRTVTGIDFIICHHQQPEFFPLLRKKMLFRASIHMVLARFYLIRALRIQSFSPEVTKSLIARGVNFKKIVEIPLGMNFGDHFDFVRKPEGKSPAKSVKIVSIGRLVWEKRIDLGIRIAARLVGLGVPIDYRIVGEGPERANLADLSMELGMENHVSLLGWRNDISEILSDADVFFHLSLTESYGQVLMEARLLDVPIFSSSCGVALEMERLKDPRVHVFISSDPDTIAEEFCQFLKQVELQRKVSVPDPKELYKSHEYGNVLRAVAGMFQDLAQAKP